MADKVTKSELKYVVTGLKNLERVVTALDKLNRAHQKMAVTAGLADKALLKVTNSVTKYDRAGNKVTISATRLGDKLIAQSKHTDKTSKSTENLTKKSEDLGKRLNLVSRIIAGSLISRGIGKLIQALSEGVQQVQEFGIRISEIRTIAQDNQRSFGSWAASVRALSDTFNFTLLDTAEGHYQTLSNQIAKGAEVTQFMTDAQQFALITVSSAADAVNLLSGALNAYKQPASKAADYSAKFFKTIELGRVRASDLASNFGQVGIAANQLGINFEELNAAIATLTIQGMSPPLAMTGLRNVILKLIRPTEYMQALFAKWGVSSGEMAIQTFGFAGVLQKLAEEASKTNAPLNELGELFGRIRAIVGATGLVTAFDKYAENLGKIEDAAESAEKAIEIMRESAGFKLKVELQKISNFFTVDIGQKAVGALIDLTERTISLSDAVKLLTKAIIELGKFLGILVVAHLAALVSGVATAGAALAGLAAKFAALAASPAAWIAAAAYFSYKAGELIGGWGVKAKLVSDDVTAHFIQKSDERIAQANKESERINKALFGNLDAQLSNYDKMAAMIRSDINKGLENLDTQLAVEEQLLNEKIKHADVNGKIRLLEEGITDALKRARNFSAASDFKAASVELAKAAGYADEIEQLTNKTAKNIAKQTYMQRSLNKSMTITRRPGRDGKMRTTHVSFPEIDDTKVSAKQGVSGELSVRKQILAAMEDLNTRAKEHGDLSKQNLATLQADLKKAEEKREVLKEQRVILEDITKRSDEDRINVSRYTTSIEKMVKTLIGVDKWFSRTGLISFTDQVAAGVGKLLGMSDEMTRKFSGREFAGYLDALRDINTISRDPNVAGRLDELSGAIGRLRVEVEGASARQRLMMPANIEETITQMEHAVIVAINAQDRVKETDKIIGETSAANAQLATEISGNLEQMKLAREQLNEIGATGAQQFDLMNTHVGYLNTSLRNMETNLDNILAKFSRLATAEELKRAAATEQWHGGYMKRFAGGGSVGSDNIPALLSAGEFVLNKESARRFLPQLVAMNSGAARFDSGGEVVNNNIGDINVTVQGGDSSEQTVRGIGAALRREIRRGTIRFN
jgi:TP901 family phage tail tape measure protein